MATARWGSWTLSFSLADHGGMTPEPGMSGEKMTQSRINQLPHKGILTGSMGSGCVQGMGVVWRVGEENAPSASS